MEKKQHILEMGSSDAENNNNNDSYTYLEKNDLTYINDINQVPKHSGNRPALAQHKKLETIINIKSNFRPY